MIIVNDSRNIPVTIFPCNLEQLTKLGISQKFLDEITVHPKNIVGVKRDTYYIFSTHTVLSYPKLTKELMLYVKLLETALYRGFHLLMVKF